MPGLFQKGVSWANDWASYLGMAKGFRTTPFNKAAIGAGQVGMTGVGNYLSALNRRSPTAWGATLGAGLGAGYGMMSDDTSVLGGALMGGSMGLLGGRYGGQAYMAGRSARRQGVKGFGNVAGRAGRGAWGRARADWHIARARAKDSKKFIGSTASRAWNPIRSTLFG